MNSHMIVVRIGLLGFLTLAMAQSEGDIRLTDAQIPTRGKIEIFHSGSWGRVCDDLFDDVAAGVICRQLFGDGVTGQAIQSYDYNYYDYFYYDIATIWIDDVQCVGNETRLTDCPHLPWGTNDCSNWEDAGVNCFGITSMTATTSTPGSAYPPLPDGQLKFQAVVNAIDKYGFLAATPVRSFMECIQQCVQCCDIAPCKLVTYDQTSKICTFMRYDASIKSVTACSSYSVKCMKKL